MIKEKENIAFETPVLFLIFNRPDLSSKIIKQISKVRPRYLFLAADGPRETILDDQENCIKAREIVMNSIDWDCKVSTLFRENNLGCAKAVSQAINWFFDHVEKGIILEDDCYPNIDFFYYSQFMLNYYEGRDDNILHITGTNPLVESENIDSIFFTKYTNVWGWATWKYAWNKFNFNTIKIEPENVDYYKFSKMESEYWNNISISLIENKVDSWAYRWQFSVWGNRGMSIFPSKNLVSNIGFRAGATHTTSENNHMANLPLKSFSINTVLKQTSLDLKVEKRLFNKVYYQKPKFANRIRNIFYKVFPHKFFIVYRNLKQKLFG